MLPGQDLTDCGIAPKRGQQLLSDNLTEEYKGWGCFGYHAGFKAPLWNCNHLHLKRTTGS